MKQLKRAGGSPAMIVAVIAMIAALGGTAIAGSGPGAESAGKAEKALKKAKKALRVAKKTKKQDGPQGEKGDSGEQGVPGVQGPPGPVVSGSDSNDTDQALTVSYVLAERVSIEVTENSRIMAAASVNAQGDGGNNDEIECFISDAGGAAGADYGPRMTAGLPDIADADDSDDFDDDVANEHTLSLVGARERGPGSYNVDLICRENSGDATRDSASLVVWAGAA